MDTSRGAFSVFGGLQFTPHSCRQLITASVNPLTLLSPHFGAHTASRQESIPT